MIHLKETSNLNVRSPHGAYVLLHVKTGKIYVGSSSDVSRRISNHRSTLSRGVNSNAELQKAYDEDHELQVAQVILTDTRDEAFSYEQEILNEYWDSGLLFNTARNARSPNKGSSYSEDRIAILREHGKKQMASVEARDKMRLLRLGKKLTPSQIETARRAKQESGRPFMANGVRFSSVGEGSRILNVSKAFIRGRCKSNTEASKDWYYCILNEQEGKGESREINSRRAESSRVSEGAS